MRILIVTATSMEVVPLVTRFSAASEANARAEGPAEAGRHRTPLNSYRYAGHDVDVLLTGVGMVATAAWCSRVLARTPRYDLALNLGVCGSFDWALQPGAVVHVVSDRVAELGAEDDEAFLVVEELKLPADPGLPATTGLLVNAAPPANAALSRLPAVDGITVNTVHGNERSIAAVVQRFNPRVESMEGAAFMYACMIHELPFAQVRAVSNIVEKRNRGAWKMAEAVGSLGTSALAILETL